MIVFVFTAAAMAAVVFSSLLLAYSRRPPDVRGTEDEDDLATLRDHYLRIGASGAEGGDSRAYEAELGRDLLRRIEAKAERDAATKRADATPSATEDEKTADRAMGTRRRLVATAAAIGGLTATIGVYGLIGSPHLIGGRDAPIVAADAETTTLIAAAERRLSESPDDVRGRRLLAPIYARLNRFDDVRRLWNEIVAVEGESAEASLALGEAALLQAGRDLTALAAARRRLERAVALGEDGGTANYYLGVIALAENRLEEADRLWRLALRQDDQRRRADPDLSTPFWRRRAQSALIAVGDMTPTPTPPPTRAPTGDPANP